VQGFTQRASEILSAAETASVVGVGSEMTILIAPDGAIRMVAESDWPLDSLALHYGAKEAFRVTHDDGAVRVEGRAGMRTCLVQSVTPNEIARRLLGA